MHGSHFNLTKLLQHVSIFASIKNKQNQTVYIFDLKLSVENEFYKFHVQNGGFCGYNNNNRLAVRLNTINMRYYFQI